MTRLLGKIPKLLYTSKDIKRLRRMPKKDLIQMICDIKFLEEMMDHGYTFEQVIEGGSLLDPIRTARIKSLFDDNL